MPPLKRNNTFDTYRLFIADIDSRHKVYASTKLNRVDAMLRFEFQGHCEVHACIAEIRTLFRCLQWRFLLLK